MLIQLASPKIDAGEAVLFSAAYGEPSVIVCTGDKRAIRALAEHPLVTDFEAGFRRKFLCIEQALLLAIREHGFDPILRKVNLGLSESLPLDTAIRSSFGSGRDSTEENVISSLTGYIEDLRKDVGDLLFNSSDL
ncbi:hypothetical protein [Novipirellula aureliae]|nr:hypothetical protein [Novipirellula aureliae]